MFDFTSSSPAGTLRDKLTGALVGLARATEGNDHLLTPATARITLEALAATGQEASDDALRDLLNRVDQQKRLLVPDCYNCAASCGRTSDYDMTRLALADPEIRTIKTMILYGSRVLANYALHAETLGHRSEAIHRFLYLALFSMGMEDWGKEELLPIVEELGKMHGQCLSLIARAYAAPGARTE